MDLIEWFDRITAADIMEFIHQGQEEFLHLDFKTIGNANLRGSDDKRNFAKSVSGFANSNGGVLIWGVDARKNALGIDCASAPAEITPIRLFLSRLNELTGEAVSPIVDAVQHKAIETTPDKGFAVTLVPESQSGPHMAKLGEDRYFKRSGASFYRMEHFDLEDMFGRRQKPNLSFTLNTKQLPGASLDVEELNVVVLNNGRSAAKYLGFLMKLANAEIITSGPFRNVSRLNDQPTVSYENNIGVIHPNGIMMHLGAMQFRRLTPSENVTVALTSYCENMKSRSDTIVLEPLLIAPSEIQPFQDAASS